MFDDGKPSLSHRLVRSELYIWQLQESTLHRFGAMHICFASGLAKSSTFFCFQSHHNIRMPIGQQSSTALGAILSPNIEADGEKIHEVIAIAGDRK